MSSVLFLANCWYFFCSYCYCFFGHVVGDFSGGLLIIFWSGCCCFFENIIGGVLGIVGDFPVGLLVIFWGVLLVILDILYQPNQFIETN